MNLLVMANDPLRRAILLQTLTSQGHTVHLAGDRAEALSLLERSEIDAVVSGTDSPAAEPVQLHKLLRTQARYSALPFVQYGEVGRAGAKELMRDGAVDFLLKRSDPLRRLVEVLKTQEEKRLGGLRP